MQVDLHYARRGRQKVAQRYYIQADVSWPPPSGRKQLSKRPRPLPARPAHRPARSAETENQKSNRREISAPMHFGRASRCRPERITELVQRHRAAPKKCSLRGKSGKENLSSDPDVFFISPLSQAGPLRQLWHRATRSTRRCRDMEEQGPGRR